MQRVQWNLVLRLEISALRFLTYLLLWTILGIHLVNFHTLDLIHVIKEFVAMTNLFYEILSDNPIRS